MYIKLTRHAMVYALLAASCSIYAQSPGGIGRQSLWLKGNFFADSAQAKTLNFNPATDMGSISKSISLPGNIEGLRRATIFTVYQSPVLDQDTSVWNMTGSFGDLLLSTKQVSSKSENMNMVFEKAIAGSSTPKKPEAIISTYLRLQGSKTALPNVANKDFAIRFGNPETSALAGQSGGLVAEFIVYETILKEKEIARIESYLALKYGITLQKNYVNSLGEAIWDIKKEELFSNNIAGIGRDDRATLYQKQGTSCTTTDQLTIGVNKIAVSNSHNTGSLKDKDYLIWGDNAQAFSLDQKSSPGASDFLLSEKKWRMKSSGSTSGTISTELKIDTKTILPSMYPKENFYLVIDRSGSGDFVPENCTYIMPDNISPEGIASFSGVLWNTNGSGKEAFSFGLKTRLSADIAPNANAAKLLSFNVYPNPAADGHYNIAITLDKATDINIKVYDIHMRLIDTKKVSGHTDYLIPGKINAASGVYIIKLFTPGKEFSQIVIRP